jgi:hypothetical protein
MRILRRFLARVKNFAMGQRSREFGIPSRWATRGNVMAVVFYQGLVLTLNATSVGVGVALPAARALTQLLFGISPARRDKPAYLFERTQTESDEWTRVAIRNTFTTRMGIGVMTPSVCSAFGLLRFPTMKAY